MAKKDMPKDKFGQDEILAILRQTGKDKDVAMLLSEENPSEVNEWIPSGCRLLDSLGCSGKREGILPSGRIVEFHALEGVGKSFLAIKCAANAQKMGFDVVFFDAEASVNSDFLEMAGIDLSKLIYAQAKSVEFVFESITKILNSTDTKTLFIIDSIPMVPTEAEMELDDLDPTAAMMVKPRLLSKAMNKILTPLANKNSTLLIINQLRSRPVANKWEDPYFVPCGKAIKYAASLVYRFSRSEAKDSRLLDDEGNVIGTEVTAEVVKSRFGTYKKKMKFQLVWGDGVGPDFNEIPYWLDLISDQPEVEVAGAWKTLHYTDGTSKKFQDGSFEKFMREDEKFYKRVEEILERVICNHKQTMLD
jgi:RecA/RadA recombinase